MTPSFDDHLSKARADYDAAQDDFKQAKAGREQLNAMLGKTQGEYNAALQDWSSDKSETALTRLREARVHLQSLKDLLTEDAAEYAKAETEVSYSQDEVMRAEAVVKAVKLAEGLQRHQEYFSKDALALQGHIVELMDKLRKTADGWDSMHASQYELARAAGLSVEQLQRRVESWGYDVNPLKHVLLIDPLAEHTTTKRCFVFPDAVDGSDLAQYAKQVVMQGVVAHYSDKERQQAQSRLRAEASRRVRPVISDDVDDTAEFRQFRREKAQRQEQEQVNRKRFEAEEGVPGRPRTINSQSVTLLAADAGEDE